MLGGPIEPDTHSSASGPGIATRLRLYLLPLFLIGVAISPSGAQAAGRGTLDPSFGHRGVAFSVTPRRVGLDSFGVIAREGDGDLIVDARRQTENEEEDTPPSTQIRLLPDGTPDPTFSAATESPTLDTSSRIHLPDGRVLQTGAPASGPQCGIGSQEISLLEADGSPDLSFGSSGCIQLSFAASSIATQPDGRILVAGQFQYGSGKIFFLDELVLARFLPDGRPDPSFGNDGVVKTHAEGVLEGEQDGPVAFAPDGEIFTTGSGSSKGTRMVAFAPDGRPDPRFGGAPGIEIPGTSPHLLLGPDGGLTILTAGEPFGTAQPGLYLARFLPDGTPDPSFGTAGSTRIQAGT